MALQHIRVDEETAHWLRVQSVARPRKRTIGQVVKELVDAHRTHPDPAQDQKKK